jgi:monoamine oxidase
VLKSGAVSFSPAQPSSQQTAIQQLGMGVLNKVYLRFATPFWEQNSDLLGHISDRKGEWAEFLNLYRYIQQPILLGFNVGTYGTQIGQQRDRDIVQSAIAVLRSIYGAAVSSPTGVLITRWKADPFAQGSYSFMATQSSPQSRVHLAEPVGDRLSFAGEATLAKHAATVHGALRSGQAAAQQVISSK